MLAEVIHQALLVYFWFLVLQFLSGNEEVTSKMQKEGKFKKFKYREVEFPTSLCCISIPLAKRLCKFCI